MQSAMEFFFLSVWHIPEMNIKSYFVLALHYCHACPFLAFEAGDDREDRSSVNLMEG